VVTRRLKRLAAADLPELLPAEVIMPRCPRCAKRLRRSKYNGAVATCGNKECDRALTVRAVWVPGWWLVHVPD
jgi:hypothetical protein